MKLEIVLNLKQYIHSLDFYMRVAHVKKHTPALTPTLPK